LNNSLNRRSIKPFNKSLLLISIAILVFLLSFSLCEIYLRIKKYPHYKRTYPGQYNNTFKEDWLKIDKDLGWSLKWQMFNDNDLQAEFKRIMFLGDSFVFGVGVDGNKSIPSY